MTRTLRLAVLVLSVALLATTAYAIADAQGRGGGHRPPQPPKAAVVIRGSVFIGGYFYDPRWGPYPWWPPGAYPWYVPVYDHRAEIRTLVKPRETAVYIDGYYAGIVDDFDGIFQSLPLPPGGHTIDFYLDGFQTARFNVYLRPASSLKLRHVMEPLPAGARSNPPVVAPPLPPPPPGTYEPPRTPPPVPLPAPTPAPAVAGDFGTLDLRVQPVDAAVSLDGAPWVSSEPGHFVVQVAEGRHRVEVSKQGYRRYWSDIDIREGETTPLNVSLSPETR